MPLGCSQTPNLCGTDWLGSWQADHSFLSCQLTKSPNSKLIPTPLATVKRDRILNFLHTKPIIHRVNQNSFQVSLIVLEEKFIWCNLKQLKYIASIRIDFYFLCQVVFLVDKAVELAYTVSRSGLLCHSALHYTLPMDRKAPLSMTFLYNWSRVDEKKG